ncbi:hypothetical protein ACIBG7_26855 [Nonomuraea sp. NPDC050328]|uniref:hypothetical protein n=1 Tax=Nonomuraea sp. NPDC050328 TaxID=3364361 RepID=UPI0037960567
MRVARVTRFGGPEVLEPGEAPVPVAGPGQVLVDVAVVGITFAETQIRRGVRVDRHAVGEVAAVVSSSP